MTSILEEAIHQLATQHRIPADYRLRAASNDDADRVAAVNNGACATFLRDPGLAHVLEQDDLPPSGVLEWLALGAISLAETANGELIGFATMRVKDGVLYVVEVSVLPSMQGKGVGSLLMSVVCECSRERARRGEGEATVSLTTFADVPWNGPWYARRGFVEVAAESIGPAHVAELEKEERDLARPGYRRCCMLWEGRD